jgi:hypothetical protein
MALMPTERMGPPPGALPPMRMTASWSGSKRTDRIQVCGAKRCAPMASSPRIITQTYNGRHQTREVRRKAHLLSIVPPRAQGSRRCETQASLRRQAAKAPLAFRSLDPFRALREPDCRRRDEKRPFPLRTKNFSTTQNNRLTGKAPYKSANHRFRPDASVGGLMKRSRKCSIPASISVSFRAWAVWSTSVTLE